MIDIYCERTGPGFWAEPVNALTNLSFFIAAVAVYLLASRKNQLHTGNSLLILLLILIGTGSFLFHTLATRWAELADVIPIFLFQVVFLWVYSKKVIGLRGFSPIWVLLAFFLLAWLAGMLPPVLNGSLMYAPAFIALAVLGFFHIRTQSEEKGIILLAAVIFLLSLTFRSVDVLLCPYFPLGTHFMWHILNGILLYMVMRGLVTSAAAKG